MWFLSNSWFLQPFLLVSGHWRFHSPGRWFQILCGLLSNQSKGLVLRLWGTECFCIWGMKFLLHSLHVLSRVWPRFGLVLLLDVSFFLCFLCSAAMWTSFFSSNEEVPGVCPLSYCSSMRDFLWECSCRFVRVVVVGLIGGVVAWGVVSVGSWLWGEASKIDPDFACIAFDGMGIHQNVDTIYSAGPWPVEAHSSSGDVLRRCYE